MSKNSYEDKYQVSDTEQVKTFHTSRIMFCIKDDKLIIAQHNVPYSHAEWFEKEGWMTAEQDDFMNSHVRGFVNDVGDIYFYIGYDFIVNSEVEKIFFAHVHELVQELKLNKQVKIYGGLIRQSSGGAWPGAKEYGCVAKYII